MMLTLPVREVLDATPRARIIRLELNGHHFAYQPGQAVLVRLDGETKRRAYSIATAPADAHRQGCLELLVGLGAQSTALPAVETGTLIEVEGPVGQFIFPAGVAAQRLVFIAGGTGIAPLRAMLRHALTQPYPDVWLWYSARTPEEFAYQEELAGLASDGRIRLKQTITRGACVSEWNGGYGRFGRNDLKDLVDGADTSLYFLCGPTSMVSDTKQCLSDFGVASDHIRIEQW
jgi:ferredoxin-NADP reductase